jgi:hypothetical protein
MGDIRLVDLEIIKRYSLAVRQESAPAEDVLAAIDASREAVAALINASEVGASEVDAKPVARPRKRTPRASKATA